MHELTWSVYIVEIRINEWGLGQTEKWVKLQLVLPAFVQQIKDGYEFFDILFAEKWSYFPFPWIWADSVTGWYNVVEVTQC